MRLAPLTLAIAAALAPVSGASEAPVRLLEAGGRQGSATLPAGWSARPLTPRTALVAPANGAGGFAVKLAPGDWRGPADGVTVSPRPAVTVAWRDPGTGLHHGPDMAEGRLVYILCNDRLARPVCAWATGPHADAAWTFPVHPARLGREPPAAIVARLRPVTNLQAMEQVLLSFEWTDID